MTTPSVCAILLTADRPEMTRRAVESFRAQTYENKHLLIYNTSKLVEYDHTPLGFDPFIKGDYSVSLTGSGYESGDPIGKLRNKANRYLSGFEIVVHWDSDDYSHPNRISEQVAFLQSSGADVVGYSDLLLWRDPESYLYTARDAQFAPGTSLCYWRKTWEAKPFPDISQGEDYEWLQNLKLARQASCVPFEPLMIASIHAGNTSTSYNLLLNGGEQAKHYMRRVTEFDSYCRKVMEL